MFNTPARKRLGLLLTLGVFAGLFLASPARAQAQDQGRVHVVLWFDTEDYILPQSDQAAKRIAVLLSQQGVRATFKVVGEKARTLERRGRRDVIGALAQHEIGYHSNLHSQHPTPAEYESTLGWEDGVAEFARRERAGFDDVARIMGQTPTCYGQPGSSWAPQAYAALKKWGVKVYLDEGGQVGLNGKPFWYGGLLNIFNTKEGSQLSPNADWSNLADAKANFQTIHARLSSRREGGIVSLYFHPCQFVHREFWDGVNFAQGANPPPEEWKLPPTKTPEESERAFKYLADLVAYMKSFPRVEFITASQASALYRDPAQRHVFSTQELNEIAKQVDADVSFQVHDDYALAASEVFFLLNKFVAGIARKRSSEPILLDGTPYGPASPPGGLDKSLAVSWSQFARTALDVAEALDKNGQIPNAVWFGSIAVPPESYLVALAQVAQTLVAKSAPPETVDVAPARLAAAQYVADDSPSLWGWTIFPEGFHAPRLMELAKLQAWTLKPARPRASH
jgi:peptidoglycan/xylan/chitin deacetylase (PgdA/CDA1 family)